MKKLSTMKKFFVIMAISGVLGGILGFSLSMGESFIIHFFMNLQNVILKHNIIIQIFIFGGAALAITTIYLSVKKKLSDLKEDDEACFDNMDRRLNILIPFITVDMILSLCFFGISFTHFMENFTLWAVIIFLGNIAFTTMMTSKAIKLTKLLFPEKKGDPLDFNFNKVWLNSCDEAEKYLIYKASYTCFQIMNIVFSGAMAFSLLISIIIDIGIYPYLLIAFFWITQVLLYSIYAIKYQNGKLENAKCL